MVAVVFDGNDMQVLRGECAVGIDEIAADINSRGEAVVFLGDGVPVYENVLAEKLTLTLLISIKEYTTRVDKPVRTVVSHT